MTGTELTSGEQAAPRVAVLGGGITGLAAALRFRETAPSLRCDLYEAEGRLGGVLGSEHADGYLVERGADMISTIEPWAVSLFRRIGFDSELIDTQDGNRRAFVAMGRRLFPVPEGFTLLQPRKLIPVLRSSLLTWRGKLRLLGEVFVRARRSTDDESLADFAIRRFGREVFERLVQPLVGGVYTADPYRLSMAATLERFARMEREQGGLIRAVLTSPRVEGRSRATEGSGARYGLFVTPRLGMASWIEAVRSRLPPDSVHVGHRVRRLSRDARGDWTLTIADPHGNERLSAVDGVVVALPAPEAATLLNETDAELASAIRSIPLASSVVLSIGARRDQIAHPLDGFGFVVPMKENRAILAGSFSSVKFAGRAPVGHVLLRIFMGGACRPDLMECDDDALLRLALDELRELIGFRGDPTLVRLTRWNGTMPQYHVGHLTLVDSIERLASHWHGLALAGNAYRGVGIPFCIRSGESAADRVASQVGVAEASPRR